MKACNNCKKEKVVAKSGTCRSCSSLLAWAKKPSTKVSRQCLECGCSFIVARSQIWWGGGNYCGRKCFAIYFGKHFKPTLGKTWKHTEHYKKRLSESRKGEKNPAYKHGAYSGKMRRGVQQPQKEWRIKIFARDGYACQVCGNKNGGGKSVVLNAHHIVPWGRDKKSRFKESNGITLCIQCHRAIHREYRRIELESGLGHGCVDYKKIFGNFKISPTLL